MAVAEAPLERQRGESGAERWRAGGADTTSRLDSWSQILADTHLAFDVRPSARTPSRFQAAVTRRQIGDLVLVDCAATRFSAAAGAG